jgi:hypothetical protein
VTASAALQARVRRSNGFDLIEKEGYDVILDDVFAAIGDDEECVDAGIAWETRRRGDHSNGKLSYFVLTDVGVYFPVTRKSLFRRKDFVVTVSVGEVSSVTTGQSEHGFLMVDFFDETGAHVAGITLHPMADPEGLESAQARRIAGALGIDPESLPLTRPGGAIWR